MRQTRALNLLRAVEAFLVAREELASAPTHNSAAFDSKYAAHDAALETLRTAVVELRRSAVSA